MLNKLLVFANFLRRTSLFIAVVQLVIVFPHITLFFEPMCRYTIIYIIRFRYFPYEGKEYLILFVF